jgi:hypothetical protein
MFVVVRASLSRTVRFPIAEILYRVKAKHFVAGVLVDSATNKILRAAPILAWTRGRYWPDIMDALYRANYQIEFVGSLDGGL